MKQLDRFTCEQVFQRLDDFIDRELTPEETNLIEEHIKICAWCAQTYAFEAGVLQRVKDRLQQFSLPPDLYAKLMASLDRAENE